jgi:predicted amidohydrolase YtcJ
MSRRSTRSTGSRSRHAPRSPEGGRAALAAQERIALPDAIAGYTIRGAYLDFTEKETGSIEVGKAADLIVLDRNLFEIPASKIHEAKVLMTFLEGREVYAAKTSASSRRS